MRAWQVGQLHQIFFSLLDDNPLKINLVDLSPAFRGSFCGFWLVVMDEVFVADGFQHTETLD